MNPLASIELLLLAGVPAVLLGGWLAWRATAAAPQPIRLAVTLLRLLGLGCLMLIALNPGHWRPVAEATGQRWALLLDRSQSMNVADADDRTRWQAAAALAREVCSHAVSTDALDIYTFAAELEPATLSGLDHQTPDGRASAVRGALQALLERTATRGGTLSGIVLISDGRAVGDGAHDDVALRARARNTPIHTVALGGPVEVADLSIEAVRRHLVAFKGQTVPVVVDVRATVLGPVRPVVRLRTAEGRLLSEQPVELTAGQTRRVRFEPQVPEVAGYLTLVAELVGGPGDTRPETDRATLGLLVLDTRLRIFLAEGEPFWDSKFLVQLLRKLPIAEVTCLYRLTADRFFRVETDLAQAREDRDVRFPDTDAELDAYDLIVIGKGAEYLLTPERLIRLQRFVRDRGGCLLFARGKPYRREFPELAALEPLVWDASLEGTFRVQPTVAGEESGLFGELLPGCDDPLWPRLPPLRQMQGARPANAFCQVLAEGVDGGRRLPLLAMQRFGKGLLVSANTDGLWQWSFFPEAEESAETYARFWTQLVQWATTGADFLPGQAFALQADAQSVDPGTPVRLRVRSRAEPATGLAPGLEVRRDGRLQQALALAPVPGTTRLWDTLVVLTDPGLYELAVSAPGLDSGGARVTLAVRPAAGENDNPSADPARLAQLAAQSGGQVATAATLAETVRAIEPRPQAGARTETVWQPRWDRAGLLLALMALLGLEWLIRRRNGLT